MTENTNINLTITADVAQAKQQFENLKKSLTNVTKDVSKGKMSGLGITNEIKKATSDVVKLKSILESSTTNLGTLDLGLFTQQMKKSNMDAQKLANSFAALGPKGKQAFADLTKSIITAEVPLKRTNKLLNEFATSLKNTVRWQISSSMLHGFMGALQGALHYAENLNKSLNNIRIVTGNSTEEMAKFAGEANKVAHSLSTTTTKYTDASLIYYQQGLSDEAVKARTDTTIKMANVTRQSVTEVSNQLTSVWNNFNKAGDESEEHFADIMAKLGATTASSTDEIATGLSKFSGIANTIGLSFEYATSALATVTATSRESAEVVGTAFKTIFARIQSLKLGETLEDDTNLNNYSAALAKVGINIKDTTGQIKDMDVILDEMGSKWQTLATDQKMALAQTVAGTRQYNQLVTLMDNWSTFQDNLKTSKNSEGFLQNQADIYAESWEASSKRVQAALEEIYDKLLDDKFFIKILDGFDSLIPVIGSFIDALGGLKGVASTLGLILLKAFGKDLASSIDNIQFRIQNFSKAGRQEILNQRMQYSNALRSFVSETGTQDGNARNDYYTAQANAQDRYVQKTIELQRLNREITAEERQQIADMQQLVDLAGQRYIETQKTREETTQQSAKTGGDFLKKISSRNREKASKNIYAYSELTKQMALGQEISEQYQQLARKAKESGQSQEESLRRLQESLRNLSEELRHVGGDCTIFQENLNRAFQATSIEEFEISLREMSNELDHAVNEGGQSSQQLQENITRFYLRNGGTAEEAASFLEQFTDQQSEMAHQTLEAARAHQTMNGVIEEQNDLIDNLGGNMDSLGNTIAGIAQGVAGLTVSFQTLRGGLQTLVNEDIPGIDRVTSVLSSSLFSLSYAIPSILDLGQRLRTLAETLGFVEEGATAAEVALSFFNPFTAAIALAAAAVGGLAYVIYDSVTKNEREFKKLQETAKGLRQEYEKIKESVENLKSSFDEYKDIETTLDGLIKGTEEWYAQTEKLNDKVLEIIQNYPKLTEFLERTPEGNYSLSEEGVEQYQKTLEAEKTRSMAGAFMGERAVEEKQNNEIASKIASKYEDPTAFELDENGQEVHRTYFSGEEITKLAERVDELGGAILTQKDALKELGLTEEQIGQITEHPELRDSIVNLAEQLQKNEASEKLYAQTIGDSILKDKEAESGESFFGENGYEFVNQLSYMLGREASVEPSKEIKDRYSKANKSDEEIRKEYAESIDADYDAKSGQMKRAGSTEFEDIDLKVARAALIYGAVADEAAKSLEAFKDKLDSANKKFNGGMTQNTANLISGEEIDNKTISLKDLNQMKEVADTKELQDKVWDAEKFYNENIDKIESSMLSHAKEIFDPSKYESLGVEGSQSIAEALNRAFSVGSESGIDFIKKGLEDSDKVDEFATALEGIEWDSETVDAFRINMTNAGVETNLTDEQIQKLIDSMKLAQNATEDLTEKYKDLSSLKDLKIGDEISDEDYQRVMEETNNLAGKFFDRLGEGTHRLVGDAAEFYDLVQNHVLEDTKKQLDEVRNQKAAMDSSEGEDLTKAAINRDEVQKIISQSQKDINQEKNAIDETRGMSPKLKDIEKDGLGTGVSDALVVNTQVLEAQFAALDKVNGAQEQYLEQKARWNETLQDDNATLADKKKALEEIAEAYKEANISAGDYEETQKQLTQEEYDLQMSIATSAESYDELREVRDRYNLSTQVYNEAKSSLYEQEKFESIDVEQLEDYTDYLMHLAESEDYAQVGSEKLSASLSKNRDAAKNLALQSLRLNQGVEDLSKNWEEWSKTLTDTEKGTTDDMEAFNGLRKSLANLLNTSEDFLDLDFVMGLTEDAEAMAEIEKAAQGDADAIQALKDRALEPIIMNMEFNFTGEDGAPTSNEEVYKDALKIKEGLQEKLDAMGDISVGDMVVEDEGIHGGTEQVLKDLNDLIAGANMTRDQVNAMLGDMGFNATFAEKPQELVYQHPAEYETTYEVIQGPKASINMPPVMPTGELSPFEYATQAPQSIEYPTYKVRSSTRQISPPQTETIHADAAGMATYAEGEAQEIPRVTGISYAPTPSAAPSARSTSNGSGNHGGGNHGGGGGSASQPNKLKPQKVKRDRYHDINNKLKINTTLLEKNKAAQEELNLSSNNLFGNEKIKNLEKQNDLLKKRADLLKQQIGYNTQKRAIADDELKGEKNKLKDLKLGIIFDDNGAITNYQQFMRAVEKKYNAEIARYNSLSKEEQESDANKEIQEKAEEEKQKALEALERYETLYYEEIPKLLQDQEDARRERISLILEQIQNNKEMKNIKLELKLDTRKLKRDWRDFLVSLQKDFKKTFNNSIIQVNAAQKDNLKSYGEDVKSISKSIGNYLKDYAIWKKLGSAKNIENLGLTGEVSALSATDAIEEAKKLYEELLDRANSVREIQESTWSNYLDSLENASQYYDFIDKKVEDLNDKIEYQKNLIELTYGDKAYSKLKNYYKQSIDTITSQINIVETEREYWKTQFKKETNRAKKNNEITDVSDVTQWTAAMTTANENLTAKEAELRELTLQRFTLLKDDFKNIISYYLDELEKANWGMNFEDLQEEWDFIQKQSSLYLNDVQKVYQIQTLSNKIQEGIDSVTGLKNQQKLEKLREKELAALREKNKLSQKDVDIAEARYQIALKEIALEEAQKNKNSMKLVRDTNGNWTYQYVANAEDIRKNRQDLLDAKNALYEKTQDAYKESIKLFMDTYSDMSEELQKLGEDSFELTTQQYNERTTEIREKYSDLFKPIISNILEYQKENSAAGYGVLTEGTRQDQLNLDALSDDLKSLVEELSQSGLMANFEDLRDFILAEGIKLSDVVEGVIPEELMTEDGLNNAFNKLFYGIAEKFMSMTEDTKKARKEAQKTFVTEDELENLEESVATTTEVYKKEAAEIRIQVSEIDKATKSILDSVVKIQEILAPYMTTTAPKESAKNAMKDAISLGGKELKQSSQRIQEKISESTERIKDAAAKELAEDALNYMTGALSDQSFIRYEKESNKEVEKFSSGGYTGEWGATGKIAVLHQKELILNQEDTKNVLNAVKIAETIPNLIDSINQKISTSVSKMLSTVAAASNLSFGKQNSDISETSNNVFNITAEFPAANDVSTIKDAILSLPNIASQYIYQRA